MNEIDKIMDILSKLSIEELKEKYLDEKIPVIYILALEKRQYITESEKTFIIGLWK